MTGRAAAAARIVALAAWALVCHWAAEASAAPFVAFAPGHETQILGLFEPFAPDQRVGDVTIAGVQVGSNTIAVQVTVADGTAARLVLTARASAQPPQMAPGGLPPSASFDLAQQPATPDPRLAAVMLQLAERVRLHDPGGLVERWTRPVGETHVQPPKADSRASAIAWLIAAGVLWGIALVALAVLAVWILRRGQGDLPLRLAMLALVAVVAFVARWHAPTTLLHCNNHGIEDLRAVLGQDLASQPRLILRYGPSFFAPQAWLSAAFGGGDGTVFAVSALVGVVSALVTTVAAWLWTAGLGAGLVAGLFAAVLPLAVRVGHSESNLVFGQLCIALMLLAAGVRARVRGVESGQAGPDPAIARRAGDILLGTATLLTATGHTFGPGYAVAVLVLSAEALVGPVPRVRDVMRAAVWFALPVAAFVLLLSGGDSSNRARLASATLSEASPLKPWAHLLWFDGAWTPWAVQALFVVGLVRFWHAGGTTRRFVVLPGLLLLAGLALFIGGSVSVALRYQSLLAPVWALVVGAAMPARLSQVTGKDANWPRRLEAVGAGALLLAGLGGTAMSAYAYGFADLEAKVYAALRPVVPTLPDGAVVLVPDREGTPDQEIIIDFPDFLANSAGRRVDVVHLGQWHRMQREAVTAAAPAVYVWRSPHCQARARVVGRWPESRDSAGLPLRAVCRPLLDLTAQPGAKVVAAGRQPPPQEDPDRLPTEYHQFAGQAVVWGLVQLPAPAHGTASPIPHRAGP